MDIDLDEITLVPKGRTAKNTLYSTICPWCSRVNMVTYAMLKAESVHYCDSDCRRLFKDKVKAIKRGQEVARWSEEERLEFNIRLRNWSAAVARHGWEGRLGYPVKVEQVSEVLKALEGTERLAEWEKWVRRSGNGECYQCKWQERKKNLHVVHYPLKHRQYKLRHSLVAAAIRERWYLDPLDACLKYEPLWNPSLGRCLCDHCKREHDWNMEKRMREDVEKRRYIRDFKQRREDMATVWVHPSIPERPRRKKDGANAEIEQGERTGTEAWYDK